jgi:hypothetical protein
LHWLLMIALGFFTVREWMFIVSDNPSDFHHEIQKQSCFNREGKKLIFWLPMIANDC